MEAVSDTRSPHGYGRALKRAFLSIVGIVVLLFLWLWLTSVSYAWTEFKEARDGYIGIKLGASMDEAYYVFGTPSTVFGTAENDSQPRGSGITGYITVDGSDPTHLMPIGKTFRDYDFWNVPKDGMTVGLRFDPTTQKLVGVRCKRTGPLDSAECPWIYHIGPGEIEQEIVDQLGAPDEVSYTGATKIIDWNSLGLEIAFREQKPYMITKNNAGRPSVWWFVTHMVF